MKRVLAVLVACLVASCAPGADTDGNPLTRLKTPTVNPLAAPPQSQDPNGGAE